MKPLSGDIMFISAFGHPSWTKSYSATRIHVLKRKNTTKTPLIGVYRITKQLDVANQKKILVGHVPIELWRLMRNFLEANTENKLVAQVTGKRKREIGLVVPPKFSVFTTDLHLAKILKTELRKRALKYTHFELKSIVIQENKFPRLI